VKAFPVDLEAAARGEVLGELSFGARLIRGSVEKEVFVHTSNTPRESAHLTHEP
jgi:hypothetical protein